MVLLRTGAIPLIKDLGFGSPEGDFGSRFASIVRGWLIGGACGGGFAVNRLLHHGADEVFDVALLLSVDGALDAARHLETFGGEGLLHFGHGAQAHGLVGDQAVFGFVMRAFELGLHEPDE